MAGSTCLDFDFSDILSNIEDIPVSKYKNAHNNGNFKPAKYFTLDTNCDFSSTFEEDGCNNDLTVLLGSHQSQNHESSGLISLAALAKDHFSNSLSSTLTSNSEGGTQDSFLLSLIDNSSDEVESVDSLQDILLGGNGEEQGKNANLKDVLNFLDLKPTTEVIVDSNLRKDKFLPNNDDHDSEIIQDIDLSFCIKKNKDKAEFSPGSLSLDSKDSGFSDFDTSLPQYNSSPSEEILTFKSQKRNDKNTFVLSRAKQSLLSRSIAAKPQIDNIRRKKLNMIKRELLMKNISLPFSEQEMELKKMKFFSVIDQSNQSVMTSSFLTIPELK